MIQDRYSIESKVVKIIDGDTIAVNMFVFPNIMINNVKIRLEGVDAQELKALQAKQTLEALILNKNVIVEFSGKKSFERYIGRVYYLEEDKEIDISQYLLENKLVKPYVKR